MLNFDTVKQSYENFKDYERKVLIVTENLSEQVLLTTKCIDADISEKNIIAVSSVFDIERCLSNSLTHIIIDSQLYSYFVSNMLEKYIEANLISIIVFHGEDDTRTIRLITDSRIRHINGATTPLLLRKMFDTVK